MRRWQTGAVVTNGIRTHYVRSGGDKPPVLLLHGATDNGRCWTPVAEALAADYDVLLPDARGHGLSEAPPDGYSSADRAADVAGLLACLGLGRVAVGGHSMGGQTALHLAAEHPDLVSCVILEDPPLRPVDTTQGPDALVASARERMRTDVALLKSLSRDAALAYARHTHPNWPEAELPAWLDANLQVSQAFLNWLHRGAEPAWTALLPRIGCPVLLVTGDPERGAIITPEVAEQARQLTANLEVVRLGGVGHNIHRGQVDAFLRTVRGFLGQRYAAEQRVRRAAN